MRKQCTGLDDILKTGRVVQCEDEVSVRIITGLEVGLPIRERVHQLRCGGVEIGNLQQGQMPSFFVFPPVLCAMGKSHKSEY